MKWTKILLALAAFQYAVFGVLALVDPSRVAAMVHLKPLDAAAMGEVRAMFGGVQLGMAAFLAACLANRWPLRAGLFLVTAVFGAAIAARITSAALDGPPSPDFAGIAAFEVAFWAACTATLVREKG